MEVGSETRRYLVLDMVAIMEGSKGYANQGNRTRPRSREQWTPGMMVTMVMFVRGALELGGDRGRRRSDTRYGNLDSQCDISVVVVV